MKIKKITSVLLLFVSLTLTAQNALNSEGLRTGPWKGFYPDSSLRYEANFRNGKPIGIMNRYDERGSLSVSMNFYPGTDRCYVKMYSSGRKVKAHGVYESQKKDSTWVYLGNDESIRMIENYKNGGLSGISESYYPSGKLSRRITYLANVRDGKWLQFFESGDTMLIASYENDLMHGKYTSFYPEGKLQIDGKYYKDLKDGDWTYLTEEGDTTSILKYNQGEILNPEELEKSYEKFIKIIEENTGNMPDPALEGGI